MSPTRFTPPTTKTGRVLAPVNRLPSAFVRSDEDRVSDFTAELEEVLGDLAQLSQASGSMQKGIQGLNDTLAKRGFFGAMKATLSGKTDKELVTFVQALGANQQTLQKVVQVMLKVLTQKNRLLHSFSDALVQKIAAVETDTRTLSTSQREVALHFLGELQQQVDEQLRHQALVERHEEQVRELQDWCGRKDGDFDALADTVDSLGGRHDTAVARLDAAEAQAAALATRADTATQEAERARGRLEGLEAGARTHAARLDALDAGAAASLARSAELDGRLVAVETHGQGLADRQGQDGDRIGRLEQAGVATDERIGSLLARLDTLERIHSASRTARARTLRLMPAALASTLALATLYLSLAT